jgi:hypothetical protein
LNSAEWRITALLGLVLGLRARVLVGEKVFAGFRNCVLTPATNNVELTGSDFCGVLFLGVGKSKFDRRVLVD